MKLTLFLGCFNEKNNIRPAIEEAEALKIDKEIMVEDNCSTDGTRELLKGLAPRENLRIIFHEQNMGIGYSSAEAINLARGDYFFGPGADREYRMADVYPMLEKMEKENLDVVFGSRLAGRKKVSVFSLIKERPFWLGTIIATFLLNTLYNRKFTDLIGIHLIKTKVQRDFGCKGSGPVYAFELLSKLCKYGYKMGEIPIYYKPRTHKEGKTIKVTDMLPAIRMIIKIKFFQR